MGMLTSGRIDIAAPAAEVFSWLVEPAKLTAWLGSPGGMPEDASQLHVGWVSAIDSPPLGKVTTEITGYEPPIHLAYRTTYAGGDSIATYRLAEGEGVTTLSLEGDTDWARPEGAWDDALDTAMEGQPESVRATTAAELDRVEDELEAGAFDSPVQAQLQQAVESSLQKLKALIEAS